MNPIALARLHAQQLARPRFDDPAALVGWLGAAQGQDYAGAKWSLGLRLPGTDEAAVERALAAHRVVRTWALRGTLHLVAAADVRWLLALVGPRVIAGNARRYRELGLDAATLARGNELLVAALAGGELLDRPALLAMLRDNGISTEGQRGVYLLQHASLDGLIAQADAPRNNPRFFALDRLPSGPSLARDEAAAELARRYFSSHGPATDQDFIWWSGLLAAEARAALDAAAGGLAGEEIDGQTLWRAPDTPAERPDAAPTAWLLPSFDEYLIAYKDRGASLAPEHVKLWNSGGGMVKPALVIDGRVAGLWRRTLKRDRVEVDVQPFAPLDEAEQAAVEAAAARYGAFLGLAVALG